MRRFLYSRWFFAFLAIVCALDLVADVAQRYVGWSTLDELAILLDAIAVVMTLWIFLDLHQRKPKHGGHPRG